MIEADVIAVSLSPTHTFSKQPQPRIHLLAGLGVEGDAHAGSTVRHRYLVRRNPAAPNLTQVHLLAAEFLADLRNLGIDLQPGEFGENITTRGVALTDLPSGTRIHLGPHAVVELTGLRTPCVQMNRLRPGLMAASFREDPQGRRTPRAGVMAVVLHGGLVERDSSLRIELPPLPHLRLDCV